MMDMTFLVVVGSFLNIKKNENKIQLSPIVLWNEKKKFFLETLSYRNTWSQNSSAFPLGKNILYMSTNLAGVSLPFGQSCCNIKINTSEIMVNMHGISKHLLCSF